MKRNTYILILFLILFSSRSVACLNYYVVDSSGEKHLHQNSSPSFIFIKSKYEIEDLKSIESKLSKVDTNEKFM